MNINDFFNKYIDYFTPELKDRIKFHYSHSKPQDHENFDEKRKNGENSEYICELIRKDSLNEFIDHINKLNIDLNTNRINPSIFETNVFLYYKKFGYKVPQKNRGLIQ
ncbi:hypothetical protein M9Y10_031551 [Tritrichomonas musculus]|uniref:Uncharacterized protein n=1 Tax=Tritrichomonas musculus TaxID=1915356 RepID=A0ABR2H2Y3_9EUKA